MRAAKNDDTGAVPQQRPKQRVHILPAGPERHCLANGLAQRTRQRRPAGGTLIYVFELGYAGYAAEDCLADGRQEGNHWVVVVNPPQIEEEHNVWLAFSHAFGQSWQIRPRPIIDDRMNNNVLLSSGDTSFFAQDVHSKA
jgi:hypothetical protein